jgi:hypothetical protein
MIATTTFQDKVPIVVKVSKVGQIMLWADFTGAQMSQILPMRFNRHFQNGWREESYLTIARSKYE